MIELTIAFGGDVKWRMPIEKALEWLCAALESNGNDPIAARSALLKALDAVQRRIA